MSDERCPWCGTAVTPGSLLGSALENGAAPKLAESAFKSLRLYTDELGTLRKRVAELEAVEPVDFLSSSLTGRRQSVQNGSCDPVGPIETSRNSGERSRVASGRVAHHSRCRNLRHCKRIHEHLV